MLKGEKGQYKLKLVFPVTNTAFKSTFLIPEKQKLLFKILENLSIRKKKYYKGCGIENKQNLNILKMTIHKN